MRNWKRYLPPQLRAKIEGRADLHQIVSNSAWLMADRVLRLGVTLFVGGWVARYLGPEQFGLFSYALAFLTIFTAVATLGLDSLTVRNLVQQPAKAAEILGTTFSLRLLGGIGAFLLANTSAYLLTKDLKTTLIVAIVTGGLLLNALDTIDLWFQANVRSKYTVYAKNLAFLSTTIAKIGFILASAPLYAFAVLHLAEIALGGFGLIVAYRLQGSSSGRWRTSWLYAVQLLRESWPLILSSMSVILYMQIDQIMLGQMIGSHAVGVYSAAVRLSEVWYFIPAAIISSVFPAIIQSKSIDGNLYDKQVQQLYTGMVWLFLLISLPIALFSGAIISLVYGNDYQASAPILAIHIWSSIFISLGLARGRWLIIEGLTRFTFLTHLQGTVINIALNLVLIPRYAGLGAAIATLISYAIASYLSCFTYSKTRTAGKMMTLALFTPLRAMLSAPSIIMSKLKATQYAND